jgi:hypothetical protein
MDRSSRREEALTSFCTSSWSLLTSAATNARFMGCLDLQLWTSIGAMNLPEFRVYAVGEDYVSPGPPEGGKLAGTVHGKGKSPRGGAAHAERKMTRLGYPRRSSANSRPLPAAGRRQNSNPRIPGVMDLLRLELLARENPSRKQYARI